MNYYNSIKERFINNEINRKVKNYYINKGDLDTYYEVGKLLIEAQGRESRAKYGDGLIKEYSKKLTEELGVGYSERNLKNMRKFYLYQKRQPVVAKSVSWIHYTILLSLKDRNAIEYYINLIEKLHLSKRQLREKIKNHDYERLPVSTKLKLVKNDTIDIRDRIKNPIIIKNGNNSGIISEKILQELILEDIPSFLNELGEGFSFINNEYKIMIGNAYNYIDLLLFNYMYNCFCVVELKVCELKKEHIGQIEIYMNYVDSNLRNIDMNKTIGIIICRENNEFIMGYCSDKRILSREFKII